MSSSRDTGIRVGAIMSADEDEVRLFGYGVYLGDEVPEPGVKFLGIDMHERGVTNPTILLDSGKKVYGCECWWGPEADLIRQFGGRRVVEVDIAEARKAHG